MEVGDVSYLVCEEVGNFYIPVGTSSERREGRRHFFEIVGDIVS